MTSAVSDTQVRLSMSLSLSVSRGNDYLSQRALISCLVSWMDHWQRLLLSSSTTVYEPVFVLATTNRPQQIDPSFRSGGRLETEIDLLEYTAEDRAMYVPSTPSLSLNEET